MDGLYVDSRRPKSKKAVKEAVNDNPARVSIESTSMFGGFDGPITEAPVGSYSFVGPDPYSDRKFYGTIVKTHGTVGTNDFRYKVQ